MAYRGCSVGGTVLPVSDASIQITIDPLYEQQVNGVGGDKVYAGLCNSITGSFGGSYRQAFAAYMNDMLSSSPASYVVITSDDHGNGVTANGCHISSGEISVKAGEIAKCTFSFVGLSYSAGGSISSAGDFSAEPAVFTGCSVGGLKCSGFSVKVDRPWSADDFILGSTKFSESIYQSGDTKVTGTITLGQTTTMAELSGVSLTLSVGSITLGTVVITGPAINVSGRSLIQKTYNFAASTTGTSFT
jgi:hypothetical protein